MTKQHKEKTNKQKTKTNIETDIEIGEKNLKRTINRIQKERKNDMDHPYPILFFWTGEKGGKENSLSLEETKIDKFKIMFNKLPDSLHQYFKNIKSFVLVSYGFLNSKEVFPKEALMFDIITINGNQKSKCLLIGSNSIPYEVKDKKISETKWVKTNKEKKSQRILLDLLKKLFISYKFRIDFPWIKDI